MAIQAGGTTARHLNTAGGRWQGELENLQTTPPPKVRGTLPTVYDQVIMHAIHHLS